MKSLYWICAIGGVASAIYIYGIAFDSFSETELIAISASWFLPMIFGIYGLIATRMMAEKTDEVLDYTKLEVNQAPSNNKRGTTAQIFGSGMGRLIGRIPLIGIVVGLVVLAFFLPFLATKKMKSPFLAALSATGIWAALLFVFLFGIFPSL